MGLYCGIDLHSNNHVLTVIDEADRRSSELRQRALYSKPLSRRAPGSRRALPLEVANMKSPGHWRGVRGDRSSRLPVS